MATMYHEICNLAKELKPWRGGKGRKASKIKQLSVRFIVRPRFPEKLGFMNISFPSKQVLRNFELKIQLLASIAGHNLLTKAQSSLFKKRIKLYMLQCHFWPHLPLGITELTILVIWQPALFAGINAQIALNLSSCFLSLIITPHTKQKWRGSCRSPEKSGNQALRGGRDQRGSRHNGPGEKGSLTCFLAAAGNCSSTWLQQLLRL